MDRLELFTKELDRLHEILDSIVDPEETDKIFRLLKHVYSHLSLDQRELLKGAGV